MTTCSVIGLCAAAVVGIGLYGVIVGGTWMRRLISFNVLSSGVFLIFGAIAHRGAPEGPDPIPQALVITGLVVAFAATALGIALILRLAASKADDEGDR